MAKLSRWTIFVRAFLLALVATHAGRSSGSSHTDETAWRGALQANTPQAYFEYLSLYPAGAHIRDALERLRRLGALNAAPSTRAIESLGTSRGPASSRAPGREDAQPASRDPY